MSANIINLSRFDLLNLKGLLFWWSRMC